MRYPCCLCNLPLPIKIFLKFLNLYSGGWNQGPLDTAATNGPLCQPRVIMMMEKSVELLARETRRKPAPVPLCSPQTPHAVRTRTRNAAVGSHRLTAWATTRPPSPLTFEWLNQSLWIPPINVCVYLCISVSLLGNGLANTFSRQRGIFGSTVLYALPVVSRKVDD
jgi:hypothetical protein